MSTIYNVTIYPVNSVECVAIEGGGVLSATPNKLFIAVFNANIVSVQGLFDNEEQEFWSTQASLTGTLFDEFGNTITTVAMFYTSGSNGNFQGTFSDLEWAPAIIGPGYTFVLSGTSDWGNDFNFPVPAEVVRCIKAVGVYSPPT